MPEIAPSGTFPLVTDYPHGTTLWPAHRGPRLRQWVRTALLHRRARPALFLRQAHAQCHAARGTGRVLAGCAGLLGAFSYAVPQLDGTFVTTTVCFENAPLTLQDLTNAITSVGVTFVELPDPTAAYAITATVTRFPDVTLGAALLSGGAGNHPARSDPCRGGGRAGYPPVRPRRIAHFLGADANVPSAPAARGGARRRRADYPEPRRQQRRCELHLRQCRPRHDRAGERHRPDERPH